MKYLLIILLLCSCTRVYKLDKSSISSDVVKTIPRMYEKVYDHKKCWLEDTLADKKGKYNIKCDCTIREWIYEKE